LNIKKNKQLLLSAELLPSEMQYQLLVVLGEVKKSRYDTTTLKEKEDNNDDANTLSLPKKHEQYR